MTWVKQSNSSGGYTNSSIDENIYLYISKLSPVVVKYITLTTFCNEGQALVSCDKS